MRSSLKTAIALGCCGTAILAGIIPAAAEQSSLYPPEVRGRPVVVVNDPSSQRRYWDSRFCESYGPKSCPAAVRGGICPSRGFIR